MMQHIATSGSEIAALKGKAGKSADGDADQGSAFDALFQQAKSSSQKPAGAESTPPNRAPSPETVKASDSTSSATASKESDVASLAPAAKASDDVDSSPTTRHADSARADDSEAGSHSEDIAKIAEEDAVVSNGGEGHVAKNRESKEQAAAENSPVKVPLKGVDVPVEDGVKTTIPVDPPTDMPDDGNLVNLETREVKLTWNDNLVRQDGDVDWLAFVDAVRQANGDNHDGEGKKAKNAGDEETLPVIPTPVSVSDIPDGDKVVSDNIPLADNSVAEITPEIPVNASLRQDATSLQQHFAVLSDALVKSVNESGEPKPDPNKQEILPIMPIVEKLTELLMTQSQQETETSSSDTELASQINKLTAQLTEAVKAAQGEKSTVAMTSENLGAGALDPESLIASFSNDAPQSPETDIAMTDAELLLNVIQTEITAIAKEGTEKAIITPVTPQVPVSGAESGDTAREELTVMRRLMNDMAQVTEETQSKVTLSLADKVVALLPAAATEQQQTTVKQAVIAGVQEIQSQLSQGHEPGIDLKAIIADAVKEANIPLTNQMMAQAEQQVSQLQQLLSTAYSAAHQSASAHIASADTMIQENTQVRSEAPKAQQQADSFDKPVNINKAEGLQQLNEKIRWMMNARSSMAEIRLDPPELGSMQVRVNVSGDTASVNFVVQSQQAREALADATPRLRDMLAEQGIELGESFVQQQSSGQSHGEESGDGQFAGSGAQHQEEEDMRVIEQPVSRESMGGIDYYA